MDSFLIISLHVQGSLGIMCAGSRKYPYPPHRWSLEIPKGLGGGGLNAKIFKGKYEPKLEFPEKWGSGGLQNKKTSMWEVWIFSGTTQC